MIRRHLAWTLLLLAASCKPGREDVLARKWQEVSIRNEQIAKMEEQQAFLDTLGTHTTPAENIRLYGSSNIDSYKAVNQAFIDQYRSAQQEIVRNTWFDFRKDGVVYLHSGNGPDSAAWYFEEDGALVLDKLKLKGTGNNIRMEVLTLNDTSLKVRFELNHLTNEASFVPYEK